MANLPDNNSHEPAMIPAYPTTEGEPDIAVQNATPAASTLSKQFGNLPLPKSASKLKLVLGGSLL